MPFRSFRFLYSLLVIVGLAAAPVLPAMGQLTIQGRLTDDRTVSPGEAYSGVVLVHNDSDHPREVRLYLFDDVHDHALQSRSSEAAPLTRSNAAWIAFSPARLTIAPGAMQQVAYDVRVPLLDGDETPAGSYWSMLVVEDMTKDSAAPRAPKAGVQIATHIEGTGAPDLAFAGVDVRDDPMGFPVMAASIANTGDVTIDPLIWVELYNENGRFLERRQVPPCRLYPGVTTEQQVSLDDLHPGRYEALIVVDAGGEHIFGAQYTVVLAER